VRLLAQLQPSAACSTPPGMEGHLAELSWRVTMFDPKRQGWLYNLALHSASAGFKARSTARGFEGKCTLQWTRSVEHGQAQSRNACTYDVRSCLRLLDGIISVLLIYALRTRPSNINQTRAGVLARASGRSTREAGSADAARRWGHDSADS
jgi:hypothetical protein